MLTVTVLVGSKKLIVGRYDDPVIAEAVARSWAKWSGCRAALIEQIGAPQVIFLRPAVMVSQPHAS